MIKSVIGIVSIPPKSGLSFSLAKIKNGEEKADHCFYPA